MPNDLTLDALLDRAAIGDLIDQYSFTLDAGEFDDNWAAALFAEDIALDFPVGRFTGRAGVAAFTAEFMGRWARTHHHAANYLVTLHGDRADVVWNMIATHVHPDPGEDAPEPFRLGGYFAGEAVRTPSGWRFTRLALRIVWRTGTPVLDLPTPPSALRPGRTGDHHG